MPRQRSRTVRSECLDWRLIANSAHLERVLGTFVDHYNGDRPHRTLDLTLPKPPALPVAPESQDVRVAYAVLRPRLSSRTGRRSSRSIMRAERIDVITTRWPDPRHSIRRRLGPPALTVSRLPLSPWHAPPRGCPSCRSSPRGTRTRTGARPSPAMASPRSRVASTRSGPSR